MGRTFLTLEAERQNRRAAKTGAPGVQAVAFGMAMGHRETHVRSTMDPGARKQAQRRLLLRTSINQSSLDADLADPDFGEELAMASLAARILAATQLLHDQLWPLLNAQNLG